MRFFSFVCALSAVMVAINVYASEKRMFPFVISYDAPSNIVNMSSLLDAPAGRHGRVFVKNGHFATEKGAIRFNAINLTGPANLPSKRYAERMADRFARFGFNCVRLHFLDCQQGYGSFMQERQPCLLKKSDDPFRWEFDPDQLDRLDYFVACLKKRGIYVNLNLHVARFMNYLLEGRKSEKGMTWLDPDIIASERDFARAFLSHRNPYTGIVWAKDPAVAMIELNNEDAAFNDCYKAVVAGGSRFQRFIAEAEKRYLLEMKKLIKGELGCSSPLAGTQLTYTSCHVNGVLDYFDAHEYWCHPWPINAKWEILDSPQVNHPTDNCIARLSSRRARGYPYTVSEYNNPYPNRTGAEGPLLIHAYGAFQNWDGIFLYSYNNRVDSEPDHVEYFFSFAARTDCLAHLPACAAMYQRGDVRPASRMLSVGCRYDDYLARFERDNIIFDDASQATSGRVPYGMGLLTGVEIVLEGGKNEIAPVEFGKRFVSDTGELEWNVERPKAGFFVVRTENTKAFTGFVDNRSFDLGDGVKLRIGKTLRDWATVTIVSKDATGMGAGGPARLLLALTGQAHNTNAIFTEHEKNKNDELCISSRGEAWGRGPFLVEGIPAEIDLPASAANTSCWALDERGERRARVPVTPIAGGVRLTVGPEWRSVWYEVEIR